MKAKYFWSNECYNDPNRYKGETWLNFMKNENIPIEPLSSDVVGDTMGRMIRFTYPSVEPKFFTLPWSKDISMTGLLIGIEEGQEIEFLHCDFRRWRYLGFLDENVVHGGKTYKILKYPVELNQIVFPSFHIEKGSDVIIVDNINPDFDLRYQTPEYSLRDGAIYSGRYADDVEIIRG